MRVIESVSLTLSSLSPRSYPRSLRLSRLLIPVLGCQLLASCASLTPVGSTSVSTESTAPAYPVGYGVPVTERTVAQRLLDRGIEHTASVNIKALDPNLSDMSRIGIDSFYSEVLLTGEVPTDAIKQQVVTVVRSMPDVRQVYDELKVAPNRGYSSTLQDGYITSKFMAKVLANQGVKSSQVKAVTDNGVLYVMGRMTPTQQSHLIDIANKTVGITELVLLTTLVNDSGAAISGEDVMQESNLDAPSDLGSGAASVTTPVNRRSILINQNGNTTGQDQPQPQTQQQPFPASTAPIDQSQTSPYIDLYKDQVQP